MDADELRETARAAADGDPLAVTALVRATQADVRRLCAHLADPDVADDLTQETYLRALRALPGYRGDAPVRVWLLGIARNTAVDHVRRRVRQRRLLQRVASWPREHQAAATGSVAEVDLLRSLDRDRREAFVLTQISGLSYQEAADALGVPVGTVRSRVSRARTDLVRLWEDRAGTG